MQLPMSLLGQPLPFRAIGGMSPMPLITDMILQRGE